MKSVVIYFSQTGNTERVAKAIQDRIQSVTGQCHIAKIKEAEISDLENYDLIGVGSPTFSLLEPGNVAVFIKRMRVLSAKDCFIFATHAGHPGNILPSMAAKLTRAGLRVIGGFNCDGQYFGPHRYVSWFTDGHPDEIDLKQAADFGREMVSKCQRLSWGETVSLPYFKWLRQGFYHDVSVTRRTRGRLRLTLDQKKCVYPQCRLCVDNCPSNAINFSTDPIIFQGRGCISCRFCEQVCPTAAVNYPEGYLAKTSRYFSGLVHKYHYPEWYKKAETELIENRGTLYRKIGETVNLDNPEKVAYLAYSQRPRVTVASRL